MRGPGALVLGAALAALLVVRLQLPAPEPGRYVSLEETTLRFGPLWCERGCRALAVWDDLVPDGLARGALAIAYEYHPEWRALARAAAERGTRVIVASLEDAEGAGYDRRTRSIILAEASLLESSDILAALLAHEVAHAALASSHPNTRAGAADCLDEEVVALAWQAATWERVPHEVALSVTGRQQQALASDWRTGRLRDYVAVSRLYQRKCFGRELRPG